jgi:hypothetical protein
MILKFFVLIILSFELSEAKQYTFCELTKELVNQHNVHKADVYKHLCVATLFTDSSFADSTKKFKTLGMFRIGDGFWCGKDQAAGGNG